MRLLLVEDNPTLGGALKKALENHAYGIDWVQDGESALESLANSNFSIVLLDINLPGMNGLEVLKTLRAKKNSIPVLMLTAMDAPLKKVEGLDTGADDYIVKPFDLDELLARIRALIRRSEGRLNTLLKCGDVELDPSASVVRKNDTPLTMTAKEFHILKLLMERTGKYVTKSDIEYSLYDADKAKESNTVEVAIYSLRKKLGSDFIKSIRGVGYMVSP